MGGEGKGRKRDKFVVNEKVNKEEKISDKILEYIKERKYNPKRKSDICKQKPQSPVHPTICTIFGPESDDVSSSSFIISLC